MPKFCANLTMLYNEHPFPDRFAAAAKDGFTAVEFLFPYAYAKEQLAELLEANGLKQILHNLPAGNWDAGERGMACLPDRVGEFQDSVGRAVEYATALKCPQINCLAGIPKPGTDPAALHETLVGNLRFAAAELKKAGVKLLVEPINDKDMPGFWLTRADQGIALIEAVGSDNLFLQYDLYHQQRMSGELLATFRRYKDRIAHMQLADNPGRNEPGTGEINYPFLFAKLDQEGYAGWIGCEYRPATQTTPGLAWAHGYLGR